MVPSGPTPTTTATEAVLAGTTLGGSGTAGFTTVNGTISPGDNGPGILTVQGALFKTGSTLAVGTEINLVSRLAKENPDKTIFCLEERACPCVTMNRIDLGKLTWCLERLAAGQIVNRITVDEEMAHWGRMALERSMIERFEAGQIREARGHKIVSYGTSSYGYDIRCSNEFKLFTNLNSTIVDPKNFDDKSFVDVQGDYCIIPPNSFALARTIEYFRVPRNILVVCLGKSTYARCGIIVNVTPLEPEWEGYVTLEFSNTTPLPAKIYANEGVAQVVFFESDEVCETSYKDRGGKYQGQKGVTLPKI